MRYDVLVCWDGAHIVAACRGHRVSPPFQAREAGVYSKAGLEPCDILHNTL